jgi:hypothetical protein
MSGEQSEQFTFPWNLPYEMDKAEPECTVSFYFTPGSKRKTPGFPGDPDFYPAEVEDIHVHYDGEDWDDEHIGETFMPDFEAACWGHLDSLIPPDPRDPWMKSER